MSPRMVRPGGTLTSAPLSRRSLLMVSTVGVGGLWVVQAADLSRAHAAVPGARDVAFDQGVASGQVTDRAVTLWTRCTGLAGSARLAVEVATDPGFGSIVARTEALADAGAAGTARVRVGGGRLRAGERYWYRFETADGAGSPVGRFRLAPPAGSAEPVRVAFFSCQEFGAGYYAAHRDLAAHDPDLVVCLGDYQYETALADGAVRTTPGTPDGQVRTLEEYRANYAAYHSDPDLRAVRAAAPLVPIWDDHEVEDNYAGPVRGGRSGEGRDIPFGERRATGYRAWFEAMPVIRDEREPDRSYGRLAFGQVDLFALDTRQYRTDQPCNPGDDAFATCLDPRDVLTSDATILGAAQRDWLIGGLADSRASWRLVANQVMAMSLDLVPGRTVNTDSWDGYGFERAAVLDAVAAAGVEDVALLTGDIHTFFAGEVSRTGRDRSVRTPGLASGAPVATEFVAGSVTSPGSTDRIASDEAGRNAVAAVLDPIVRAANPHLAYANTAYKGYGILDASADALSVRYRAVREPRDADSDVITLASFRVPRGRAQVEVAGTAAARATPPGTRRRGAADGARTVTPDDATDAFREFLAGH
ncbi:MAG: alkaline phosphatase D family protein [Phycicoccus sp.]